MTITEVSLLDTLTHHAADPALRRLLLPHPAERTWRRLLVSADVELWLISWPAGARTDWHDHGSARGAFTVLEGRLVEHSWDGALRLRDLTVGGTREFGASHVHDVRNDSTEPALSLHAYAPRLEVMTRYQFLGDRVEVLGVEKAGVRW
jgi:quercetin dioxygenase-like cupin family protein